MSPTSPTEDLVNRGLNVSVFPASLGPEREPLPGADDFQLDLGNDFALTLAALGSHPVLAADQTALDALTEAFYGDRGFFDGYSLLSAGATLPSEEDHLFLIVLGHLSEVMPVGRTARVSGIMGPGALIGLDRALRAWLTREGIGSSLPPDRGQVHRALPLPHFRLIARDAVREAYRRLREQGKDVGYFCVSFDRLFELLAQHRSLQLWLRHSSELTRVGHMAFNELIDQSPILSCLDLPSRHLLAQSGVICRPDHATSAGRADVHTLEPWQLAGTPPSRVALLTRGAAKFEAVVHGEARTLGLARRGALLNGPFLRFANGVPDTPGTAGVTHSSDIYLDRDSELILWDLDLVRRLTRERAAPWLALAQALAPGPVSVNPAIARVTVVASGQAAPARGADPGGESAIAPAALHLATALARRAAARGAEVRGVVLIDPDGPERLGRDLGAEVRPNSLHTLMPGTATSGTSAQMWSLAPRLLEVDAASPWSSAFQEADVATLPVGAPGTPGEGQPIEGSTLELVSSLRGTKGITDVVLILRADTHDPLGAAGLVEHLRREPMGVIWLADGPVDEWTITPEPPDDLVRVDLVGERWRATARSEVVGKKLDDATILEQGHPPYTPVRHFTRLVDEDADGFTALRTGRALAADGAGLGPAPGSQATGSAARTAWRLSRMVHGETVGVALSGGGVWGYAHMALVSSLTAAGLPVDYVSGTSFGSVVGALYVGGGVSALDDFTRANRTPQVPTRILRTLFGAIGSSFFRAVIKSIPFSTRPLARMVDRVLSARRDPRMLLDETEVPFLPVGSDLTSQLVNSPRWTELSYGVRVASGLPPIFPGLRIRGHKVVDGAFLSNVPAALLRDNNADFVVAANVIGAPFAAPLSDMPLVRLGQRLWDATGQRPIDAFTSLWLVLWKASSDQGRLYADVFLDLRIDGVGLFEGWVAPQVVSATKTALLEARIPQLTMQSYRQLGTDQPVRIERVSIEVPPV